MDSPRFTVVTPVLNGERYISETIESVLAQSYPHWRYIIMDGGSTDSTLAIANSYAETDDRITVASGKDKGMYDALFKGLELDDGEICCWINADDKYVPWSFSIVADAVLNGHDWVTGYHAFWDMHGRLITTGLPRMYPRWLIRAGYCHGRGLGFIQQESTFFTRKLLSRLSNEQLNTLRGMKLAGDFGLWKFLAEHSSLYELQTVIGGFRVHESNMSGSAMEEYYEEVKQLGGKYLPYFIKEIPKAFLQVIALVRSLLVKRATLRELGR